MLPMYLLVGASLIGKTNYNLSSVTCILACLVGGCSCYISTDYCLVPQDKICDGRLIYFQV